MSNVKQFGESGYLRERNPSIARVIFRSLRYTYLLQNRGHRVEIRSPVRREWPTGGDSVAAKNKRVHPRARKKHGEGETLTFSAMATRIMTLTSATPRILLRVAPRIRPKSDYCEFKRDREDAIAGCAIAVAIVSTAVISRSSFSFLRLLIYQRPLYDSGWS